MGSIGFRWGIIGPGRIAKKFAISIPFSNGGLIQAVASSDMARAQAFATEFGAAHAFGSYAEMLDSGEIDAVYIATPHPYHFQSAKAALERKIPVLCEKPLTNSLAEAQELIRLATENQVFLMEAMWTAFLPHFQQAMQWVKDGEIGEVLHCQADFGFAAAPDLENRQFNPALGGGVLKDIGVYPLALFHKVLGELIDLQAVVRRAMTGVDAHVVFQGQNVFGATFQAMVTFGAATETIALIQGTKGKIVFDPQWLRAVGVTLIRDSEITYFAPNIPGMGFQFEANEVMACVGEGRVSSEIWPLTSSLEIARAVDVLEQF